MSLTPPITRNYDLYMGDDFYESTLIKINGTLADISGDTFKISVVDSITGELKFTLELGSGITSPSTGRIIWTITKAQTATLDYRCKYRYDLQWSRSTGQVLTMQRGLFTPIKDVTP